MKFLKIKRLKIREGYDWRFLGWVDWKIKRREVRSGKACINYGKIGSDYKY